MISSDNPGTAVEDAVRRALVLVDTWIHWDGRARVSEDGDRIYTPHKAVRRIADHLVDHLAEVEAQLAGVETQHDGWHASLLTVDSDWARFTEADRDEAHQRLPRLARTFALRRAAAGPDEWDRARRELDAARDRRPPHRSALVRRAGRRPLGRVVARRTAGAQ
jgi:hypothetical protein